MKTLLLFVLALAALFAAPAAAQDWWNWAPFPACSNGQVWVWSTSVGGMTCAANSSTDLVCTNCIGGTEVDESTLTLAAYVPVTKAGQQSIAATGTGNDVTVTAADDVILTPTGDLTVTAAAAGITATGAATITSDTAAFAATTSFAVDVNGGTDELGIAEGEVSVSSSIGFRLVASASPPYACAAPKLGGLYADSDSSKLCFCDGTNWVQVEDLSTTAGCVAP